jgi:hypothetical protein
MFRKVVSYVMIMSNLGDATDVAAVRETTGSCRCLGFGLISSRVGIGFPAIRVAGVYGTDAPGKGNANDGLGSVGVWNSPIQLSSWQRWRRH